MSKLASWKYIVPELVLKHYLW